MTDQNIFSALAKYNPARKENYLTEALVFVINALLQRDRSVCLKMLNKLCIENSDFSFNEDEKVCISTEEIIEQGRPDITVSSPDKLSPEKLIYIEVKDGSPFDPLQISKYIKALDTSKAIKKHVVSLTRFAPTLGNDEPKPYKHVHWFDVCDWMGEFAVNTQDPVSRYLMDSFTSFLEEKDMCMGKIEMDDLTPLFPHDRLYKMVKLGVLGAGLTISREPKPGKSHAGYILEGGKFWCGVYNDEDRSEQRFEVRKLESIKYDLNKIETCKYKLKFDKDCVVAFCLPLKDRRFHSFNKARQLETLTNFYIDSHEYARMMTIE